MCCCDIPSLQLFSCKDIFPVVTRGRHPVQMCWVSSLLPIVISGLFDFFDSKLNRHSFIIIYSWNIKIDHSGKTAWQSVAAKRHWWLNVTGFYSSGGAVRPIKNTVELMK